MKCPHCITEFFPAWQMHHLQTDADTKRIDGISMWKIRHALCPACNRLVVQLGMGRHNDGEHMEEGSVRVVRPKGFARPPLSDDVTGVYAGDYKEAVAVLEDSPKASAALSRRCLQHVIREKAGIKGRDLAAEIQTLIDSNKLPSHLSEAIDGVRQIGNFAAHPIKSTSTGEVVEVEQGEAEWLLDTLEGLFDFYFIQPAILKRKRDALNAKLASTGKPPMKG